MSMSAVVSLYLVLKEVKLLVLHPARHTGVLLLMSVSVGKAWSRAILVFFGLDPAAPSF